jgi:4-alpha-glucanotransferase
MNGILERAAARGVATEFRDAFGRTRIVAPEVLARLLEAFPEAEARAGILPRSVVFRDRSDRTIRLDVPAGLPISWAVSSEREVVAQGQAVSPSVTLPPELPNGIFQLAVTVTMPSARRREHASVVVCPARAWQGATDAPRRMWALSVQLYGVRSQRNWGHGDFGDLAWLIALAAELGASGIALNPLHALFDDHPEHASPYSPNSRLFLNPLYIDVESVPEFRGVREAGWDDLLERLRTLALVDYAGVAEAKWRALRVAHGTFRRSASAERRDAFERFRQERGELLARFASFEVLRRKFNRPWWQWPQQWRRPDSSALDRLRAAEPDEIGYGEFIQWVAHEQLDACRMQAVERGLPIGLLVDVAVGVRADGFDAWHEQEAFLPRMSIGAPPDILNTAGQNWGLTGFNPNALEARQFEPFCRMLQASMRYAGAIRLDHVLGLNRLYVIPDGLQATDGTYIRCPAEALLGIAALLSVENECIVVGEDLGTVPDNFRELLADWGLWSYQVMLFERSADGAFLAPESYRESAVVVFATHDLPTFAGWQGGHDLATKEALGIDPGETRDERGHALQAASHALARRGLAFNFQSVAEYLAATPSRLVMIATEDVLELAEQVNVPGTVDEHPNWRRRLPIPLELLETHESLRALANALAAAGRSYRDGSPTL